MGYLNYLYFSILFFILVLSTFLYQIKRSKPIKRKAKLKADIQNFINKKLNTLHDLKFIGVGKVGAVFSSKLSDGWENQLRICWKTSKVFYEDVAVKLCLFKGKEKERCKILSDIADIIDKAKSTSSSLEICEFYAIGLITDSDSQTQYVVEIMSLIKGKRLDVVLKKEYLNPKTTIPELLKMLETVLFLEENGYYTRNLDVENIIVQPDDRWIRIDFDNLKKVSEFPLLRMERLTRMCRKVLNRIDNQAKNPRFHHIIDRLKKTENTNLKKINLEQIPTHLQNFLIKSPQELIDLLKELI